MTLLGKLRRDLAREALPPPPAQRSVMEADIAGLPDAVQRYLRFMRVPGSVRVESFRMALRGRFRTSQDAAWLSAKAWQYSRREPIARMFYMRLRMAGVVPVIGRDTYRDGRGRMRIRPLDFFTVEDAQGPEYDVGELVTWLNDAVLIAPSMLLGDHVRFAPLDPTGFTVEVTDHGRTAQARVRIDARGAPLDFETDDRFMHAGKAAPLRTRWSTPVSVLSEVDGRPVMGRGRAIWHLESGPYCYAELEVLRDTLAFNLAP